MRSSIFWSYGCFLYWMTTILILCHVNCDQKCPEIRNWNCTCTVLNKTIILLQNCEEGSYLNLARIYEIANSKSAIAIRNSAEISLYLHYSAREVTLFQIRQVHLIVENVVKVTIHEKTFDQVVINAVFRNITNLNLREKSFGSCWGAVWLFNVPDMKPLMANAFSSSDMVVYRDYVSATDNPFTTHARPELTPLQKFNQVYHISAKVADLEITIYAVLILIGAVILTLISLTIVVARKFVPPSTPIENLPDVVRIPKPAPKKRNNPVTKVSRISRVVFNKRGASKEPHHPKSNNKQQFRPPLPPPRDI